jgi:hypothetical protein
MTDLSDAAARLKKICDDAYDNNAGSCSNAVWDVIKNAINPKEPYRVANELIDCLSRDWKTVSLEDGFQLANKGIVVIGGAKATPNGHVIAIYPGDKKQNGGYLYFWKKEKKNIVMRATGFYPRALSTSMGQWPGARSRGDKTVWDPWGSDDAFDDVEFWTPKS